MYDDEDTERIYENIIEEDESWRVVIGNWNAVV